MSKADWPSVAFSIGSSSTFSPIRSWADATLAGSSASEIAFIAVRLLLASGERGRLWVLTRS